MSMIFDVEVNNVNGADHLSSASSEMDSSGGGGGEMDFEASSGGIDGGMTPCRKESAGLPPPGHPSLFLGGGLFGGNPIPPKTGGGGPIQQQLRQPLSVDFNVHNSDNGENGVHHSNLNPGGDTMLKEQVLISHLTNATGCTPIQARHLLEASRWEFETALSLFFQDPGMSSPPVSSIGVCGLSPPLTTMATTTTGMVNQQQPQHQQYRINGLAPMQPPCNTPATPPSFPDALLALSKMKASDWSHPSPASPTVASNTANTNSNKQVLSTCNHQQIIAPTTNTTFSTTQERHGTNGQSMMAGAAGRMPSQGPHHQHQQIGPHHIMTTTSASINPPSGRQCDWTGIMTGTAGRDVGGDRMAAGNNMILNEMIPKDPSSSSSNSYRQQSNSNPSGMNLFCENSQPMSAGGGNPSVNSAFSSPPPAPTATGTGPTMIIGNNIQQQQQQQHQILFPIEAQP